MSRDDIQKLLGGYATGTLTPEEQRTLFEAALEDQELFDALAREEALREVLSDPSARAQLLAAMDDAPAPWHRRWWRPAPLLAMAAVLLAVVGVALWWRAPARQVLPLAKLEMPPVPYDAMSRSTPLLPPPPKVARATPALAPFTLPAPAPAAAPAPAPPPPPEAKGSLAKDEALSMNGIPAPQLQQAQQRQTAEQLRPRFAAVAMQVPLRGVVTDASGAAIRSASVVVKSATGQVVATSTDERGEFNAAATRGSTYEISASAPGFQQAKATGTTPPSGTPEPVKLKLDVGSVNESVEVSQAASGGGARAGLAGALKARKQAALEYHLLRRMPGGSLEEVPADGTVPPGAALILRVTPPADGYLRIVSGSGGAIAPSALKHVKHAQVFETALPPFDQPGRVELQVYFSRQKEEEPRKQAPTATITINIR
jgi:hypothetical protein